MLTFSHCLLQLESEAKAAASESAAKIAALEASIKDGQRTRKETDLKAAAYAVQGHLALIGQGM